MPKVVSDELYNRVKRMYVEEGLGGETITAELQGAITKNTVRNWARKVDPVTGKSWKDLRREVRDRNYEKVSPAAMANRILNRIHEILYKQGFTNSDADALAKLQRSLERLTDKRFQIPVMFQFLEDQVKFMRKNYGHLMTEEYLTAIRHFKNELRARLEEGA